MPSAGGHLLPFPPDNADLEQLEAFMKEHGFQVPPPRQGRTVKMVRDDVIVQVEAINRRLKRKGVVASPSPSGTSRRSSIASERNTPSNGTPSARSSPPSEERPSRRRTSLTPSHIEEVPRQQPPADDASSSRRTSRGLRSGSPSSDRPERTARGGASRGDGGSASSNEETERLRREARRAMEASKKAEAEVERLKAEAEASRRANEPPARRSRDAPTSSSRSGPPGDIDIGGSALEEETREGQMELYLAEELLASPVLKQHVDPLTKKRLELKVQRDEREKMQVAAWMQEERDLKERLLDDVAHHKAILDLLGDKELAEKISRFVDNKDLEDCLRDHKGEVNKLNAELRMAEIKGQEQHDSMKDEIKALKMAKLLSDRQLEACRNTLKNHGIPVPESNVTVAEDAPSDAAPVKSSTSVSLLIKKAVAIVLFFLVIRQVLFWALFKDPTKPDCHCDCLLF